MKIFHNNLGLMLLTFMYAPKPADSAPYVVTNSVVGSFTPEWSPSQLSEIPNAEFLIVPGTTLDTNTTIITDRYECSNIRATFAINGTDNKKLNLTLTTTWDLGDNPKCDVDWGDGSNEEVVFDPAAQIDVEHTYADYGAYALKFDCSDDAGNGQKCPIQNDGCVESPELFDVFFRSLTTPFKCFVNERIQFDSSVQIQDSCLSQDPVINWRLDRINGSDIKSFTNFTQPNNSVLIFQPFDLEPGLYVLGLELTFHHVSMSAWNADYMLVYIILPELVATISGGTILNIPHGTSFTVDASRSNDPVASLESISGEQTVANWSFVNYPTGPLTIQKNLFTKLFPTMALPAGSNKYAIQEGDEYLLTVDSSFFPANTWCVVMFSIKRGVRASSVIQWIKLVPNSVPVTISCIKNCHAGREKKILDEEIMLDSMLPQEIQNMTGVTYSWTILVLSPALGNIFILAPLAASLIPTGRTSRSIGITRGALSPGQHYKIKVQVTAPGYAASSALVVGTVNYVPYAGTCVLDKSSGRVSTLAETKTKYKCVSKFRLLKLRYGIAATDLFAFTCSGWKGADDRITKNAVADINPLLSLSVIQKTTGVVLELEPILFTRSMKSYLVVKIGDPTASYQTTIYIRVTDLYKNYVEIPVLIQASPAFDWAAVDTSQAGADIVSSYLNTEFKQIESQIRKLGKTDLLVPLVSSVASHVHLIHLPVWTPPVPRELTNDDGVILDLAPGGNKDVGTLDEVTSDALTVTTDPATIALQQLVTEITKLLEEVTVDNIINGTRGGDKQLISMVTNGLTNLAASDQYVNQSIKATLIFLGRTVGQLSLVSISENSTVDDSAEIEVAAGDANQMSKKVIGTAVPDTLGQIRALTGYQEGRSQISNVLDVVGQNICMENTTLTPEERAWLYYRMQLALAYETDKKRETARQAAMMTLELARQVQNNLKLCSVCSNENSSNTDQRVLNNKVANMSEQTVVMKSSSFVLDGLANALAGNSTSDIASTSALELDENVFMYDNDKESSRVTSKILHVDVKSDDTLISPGNVTFNQDVATPEAKVIAPVVEPDDASQFSYHKFIYSSARDQVCIIIKPENETKVQKYPVYVNFKRTPTLLNYEFQVNVSAEANWQVCIHPEKMRGHTGIAYLGIQVPKEVQMIKYHFNLVTVACMVWEEDANTWLSDKCDLTWKPDEGQLQCKCHDVKDMTFGNSFVVAPNTIDFTSVFLKFSPLNQAAVIGMLSGLFIVFFFIILWAIGRDRKDFYRWSITPLLNNYHNDHHYYIIKVFTGMRQGAGTRSNIGFTLFGEKRDTGARSLYDGVRKEFGTGSVFMFLLANDKDLGNLSHLQIWHDNSGEGSYGSWYLNQVMVYDVRWRKTYVFPCERWLSVETSLEAALTAVSEGNTVQFESRFFTHVRDRISENHMWMSIFYRPVSSTFNRVERASCALAYIILTMVANAMYYDTGSDYELPAIFEIGPFRFTPKQVYVSLICALITTPVMMLIITIFKRTRRKPELPGNSKRCYCCGFFCYNKPHDTEMEKILLSKGAMEERGFYFPYFFIYVAWLLVLSAVVVPAFFILLFSMTWGKQKSEEWLTSFFMSLFESIIFVDPFLVLSITLILAIILRFNRPMMGIDFVTLIRNYRRIVDRNNVPIRAAPGPLEGHKLEEEKRIATNRTMAYTTLRDILLNLFLIWIVCSIAYSNRDPMSYYHHRVMENLFLVPKKLPHFEKIKTPSNLYTWLDKTVFPSLFPESDINGDPLHWRDRQYMTGIHSYRLGPPRLRQLRITKDICHIPGYGSDECYGHYTMSGEDTRDYCIGWKPFPCPSSELAFLYSPDAWKFTSAFDIWGIPIPGVYTTYGGGGYSAEFDISKNTSLLILNELYTNIWLDRHTRAVILEFTVYTPNTNMFTYNMFMVEFPETGGAFTSYSIAPLRLYHHYGPGGIYALVCECILVIYLVILLTRICIRVYQQQCQYFKQVWQVYECIQFLVGVTTVVVYFIRFIFTNLTIDNFNEDKRIFVNFQHIKFWDQLLVLFLGILVFMATLRLLQVLETSKRVNAVVKVFSDCASSLTWFGIMFIYIFMGFCILGTLLFGSVLTRYKNVFQTMGTLFISLIGKSNYREISLVTPVLANLFFLIYIITTVFFILTIFLSILGGSIDTVIHNTRNDNSEDIIETVMTQFKRMMWRPKKNSRTKPRKIKQIQVVPFQDVKKP